MRGKNSFSLRYLHIDIVSPERVPAPGNRKFVPRIYIDNYKYVHAA